MIRQVIHTYNPRTQEAETGGLQVRGQTGYVLRLHLKEKGKKKEEKKKENEKLSISFLSFL